MKCPRCLNTDPEYFYKGSRGWYCRRCISFGRAMIEEETESPKLAEIADGAQEYTLQYPLTPAQEKIAVQCAQLIDDTSVLINAACGCGKTELVVYSIAKMLKEKKKVCFAIPRRQVVLELRERLAQYFPKAKVTAVCGGHTKETDGDLIICTTHQLYRYYRSFDLLILDEPDAFPFYGNDVLHGIAETSCRGHTIYLTATPDETLCQKAERHELVQLNLFRRPHGHPIPVPRMILGPRLFLLAQLLIWIHRCRDHPRMIFAPSIRTAHILHRFLSVFMKCFLCSSHTQNRDQVIAEFRKQKAGIIIATTVLERGVTVPGADICVWNADSGVFSEASLIQMAGRAGRSFQYPDGDVLFLCMSKSSLVKACAKTIEEANACAV